MEFLRKILPDTGLICVAVQKTGINAKGESYGYFKHEFFENLDEAQIHIDARDRAGDTVYVAQATFNPEAIRDAEAWNRTAEKKDRKKLRAQANAQSLKSFFFDIDCGPGKPYPDQRSGVAALKEFLSATGLPFPAVLSSGNGLYAYWILDAPIPASQWRTLATTLKHLSAHHKFATDPSRTADSASVLRPPGTHNRKNGLEKPVVIVRDAAELSLELFAEHLRLAAKNAGIETKVFDAPRTGANINAEFDVYIHTDTRPSLADRIALHCLQVRRFAELKGNVEEPLWYAMLGLLRHTENGDEVCQEWSSGHPEYSPAATARKIEQHVSSGAGPTTCAHLSAVNSSGCLGCSKKGSIKSPIQLGYPEIPQAEAPETSDGILLPDPPKPFKRTEAGLAVNIDGREDLFYPYDFFPIRLAYDDSLGYEIVTWRHHLPHEGWLEFTHRSALVNDPKNFFMTLWDNHIKVVGNQRKKYMIEYAECYLQHLQSQTKLARLFSQMGWKDTGRGPAFVLGDRIITATSTANAGMAKNIPAVARAYFKSGSIEPWVESTEVLGRPGLEPLAFALLAGAFGAPLMKFTGFEGAMVSLCGDSGAGKTLIQRMIQSAYGEPSRLMMLKDDTKNSLVSRLGVYGSLPLTVDEVTNLDPLELSELVYRVTQGRDKARLSRSGVERNVLNYWNTLAVVSTNSSLVEKLAGLKSDASAEINRIFEVRTDPSPALNRAVATGIYRATAENFGHAGERYIQHLLADYDQHRDRLDTLSQKIDRMTDAKPEERFWSVIAATAIYGGLLAKKLGLIRFEVSPLVEWCATSIVAMRACKGELVQDAVGLLGQFLDDTAPGRLITDHNGMGQGRKQVTIIQLPRGPLSSRQELDTHRLYISRDVLRAWLGRRHGDYRRLQRDLENLGALKRSNARKTLGGGTPLAGTLTPVWEIDLNCRALGHVRLALVESANEAKAKAKVEGY